MIITAIETVPEEEITESPGIVKDRIIHAKYFGKGIFACLHSIVNGEIEEYVEVKGEMLWLVSCLVLTGVAELLVYGVVVKIK